MIYAMPWSDHWKVWSISLTLSLLLALCFFLSFSWTTNSKPWHLHPSLCQRQWCRLYPIHQRLLSISVRLPIFLMSVNFCLSLSLWRLIVNHGISILLSVSGNGANFIQFTSDDRFLRCWSNSNIANNNVCVHSFAFWSFFSWIHMFWTLGSRFLIS